MVRLDESIDGIGCAGPGGTVCRRQDSAQRSGPADSFEIAMNFIDGSDELLGDY
jgi:hypothetical protein